MADDTSSGSPSESEPHPYPVSLSDLTVQFSPKTTLLNRENTVIACLQTRGWEVEPLADSDLDANVHLQERIYRGYQDAIEKWGYGLSTSLAYPNELDEEFDSSGPTRKSFEDNLDDDDRPAFYLDLNGTDETIEESCWAQGQYAVNGKYALESQYHMTIEELEGDLQENLEYQSLNDSWSECMAIEGGGNWSSPYLTKQHFMADSGESNLTETAEQERTVATADFTCRDQLDYTEQFREIAQSYMATLSSIFPA